MRMRSCGMRSTLRTWTMARGMLIIALISCCVASTEAVEGRGPGLQSKSRSSTVKQHHASSSNDPSSSTANRLTHSKVVDNETDRTLTGGSGSEGGSSSSSISTSSRFRKRSKWHSSSSSYNVNKEGSFLKRIVTEVIAERDAQIAAALFEVAKNQPHLQMMVQTLGELSQSNQRLELSSTRLDETQRRLDSRMGVIKIKDWVRTVRGVIKEGEASLNRLRMNGEKMTLLETRLGQTERRIEREMTHVHGKLDDFFRGLSNNVPDKSGESLMRAVKQLQNQVNLIEELLLDRAPSSNHNKLRSKSRQTTKSGQSTSITPTEIQKLGNSLSQALAAAHNDLVRVVRESETNLDHQLSMLASDNGVFSCAISRLMERTSKLSSSSSSVEANSIQSEAVTLESFATNGTRCILKCP